MDADDSDSGGELELDRATLKSRAAAAASGGAGSSYAIPKAFRTPRGARARRPGAAPQRREAEAAPPAAPASRAEQLPVANGRARVALADFSFQPAHVRIPVGTTLEFAVAPDEMGAVEYTVSAPGPRPARKGAGRAAAAEQPVLAEFESPPLTRGDVFEWPFVNVGTVELRDPSYPDMTLRVEVVRAGMSGREVREVQRAALARVEAERAAKEEEEARLKSEAEERARREAEELENMSVVGQSAPGAPEESDEAMEARFAVVQDSLEMWRAQKALRSPRG